MFTFFMCETITTSDRTYDFILGDVGGFMGLLLGGSVLTVFELIDLIVFRFINTVFAGKEKDEDEAEAVETGTAGGGGGRVQSVRSPERPVSAVSTISPPQRRIRRIAKYQPPISPPTPGLGGRPALVIQTNGSATSAGLYNPTINRYGLLSNK